MCIKEGSTARDPVRCLTLPSGTSRIFESRKLMDPTAGRFDHNLMDVIAKALEKRVARRYGSVDEMHDAVYRCRLRFNFVWQLCRWYNWI